MKKLHDIWSQVPRDYFSQGTKTNLLQKIWHNGKFQAVVKIIGRPRVKTLVEVGSADGSFVHRVSEIIQIQSITAIDPYFLPLQFGQYCFQNIHFLQGDAHDLSIKSNTVDVITVLETLEHVVDPYAVLLELKRTIRKDGHVIVEIDSGSALFQVIWFLWKKFGKGKVWRGAHLTLFNVHTLERLFIEAGLKIKQKRFFNWGMGICYDLQK